MFTQPAAAPSLSGLQVTASPSSVTTSAIVSPSSPTSRSSRLRGLSYLRNYTQSHLLNREHSASGSGSTTGGGANPAPPQHQQPSSPTSAATASRPAANLTRSVSYSPTSAATSTAVSASATISRLVEPVAGNRFSLVHALSHQPNPTSSSSSATAQVDSRGLVVGSRTAPALPTDPSPRANTRSAPPLAARTTEGEPPADLDGVSNSTTMTRTRSATEAGLGQPSNGNPDILPSIRFSTFYDPRATRPSLTFTPVARTLPTGSEVIRVGRYSERDNQPNVPSNVPSAAPVGFKSKVVSRRHCEFWYEAGKWYIKDVKSSSGTFLNHIRLSPPGTESKPFPVNDGDIVQLGIDFKGGEEMIFRCVKMRLELNRGWQNKLNAFNLNTHKRLRNMTKSSDASSSAQSPQDCSICLNSIAPCQCLFVAPCSHTWHYKCIRALLASPQYPIFMCPNCRAVADLEAEVEDPEEWAQLDSDDGHEENGVEAGENEEESSQDDIEVEKEAGVPAPRHAPPPPPPPQSQEIDIVDVTMQIDSPQPGPHDNTRQSFTPVSHATSEPVPIPVPASATSRLVTDDTHTSTPTAGRQTRTPSPSANNQATNGHEGPITPRNDAGPWVFDGSGVRATRVGRTSTDSRRGEMRNLDTAAAEIASHIPA